MDVLSHSKDSYDHFDRSDDITAEEAVQEGSIVSLHTTDKRSVDDEAILTYMEHNKAGIDFQSRAAPPMDENISSKNNLSTLVDATQTLLPSSSTGMPYLYPYPLYLNSTDSDSQAALVQQQLRYFEGITQLQQLKEGASMRDEEVYRTPSKRRKTMAYNIPTNYGGPHYTARFLLLEQPNVRQRKSYKNENR